MSLILLVFIICPRHVGKRALKPRGWTRLFKALLYARYADKRGRRRREEGANALLLYRLYAAKLGQHVFAFLLEQVSPVDKHGHKLFDKFGICLDDLPCSLVALVCYFVELGVYFVQLFLRIGKIFVAASAVSQIRPLQPVQSALILTRKNYPKSRIGKIPGQFLNDRKIDIAFFGLCRNPENTRIHAAVPGIQNDSIARILLRSSIRF